MFGFNQNQNFSQDEGFAVASHLRDTALELGLDVSAAFGLSADMEAEQLAGIQATLQAAIQEAIAEENRNRLPTCHIGPYANGICTICGLLQP